MIDLPESSALPLFPLRSVLFPGGLLSLKVFEARYLDLVSQCLRTQRPFGVIALRQGQEVRREGDAVAFEAVGCLAELIEVDSEQAGILQVRCRGTQRFRVSATRQRDDGLWLAMVDWIDSDERVPPSEGFIDSVRALANAIQMLRQRGPLPFLEPFLFDEAGWIANRWCEILPIPLAARQKLMELEDPQVRLKLVDQFLRSKGIIGEA
jgi:Lon protease-like protein